jgi:hypothetical protein
MSNAHRVAMLGQRAYFDDLTDTVRSTEGDLEILVRRTVQGWRVVTPKYVAERYNVVRDHKGKTLLHKAIVACKTIGVDHDGVAVARAVSRALYRVESDALPLDTYLFKVARALRTALYTTKAWMLEGECEPKFTWRDAFGEPWVWGDGAPEMRRLEMVARSMFLTLADRCGIAPVRTDRDPW